MHERMHKSKEEALEKWHLVGSESITVPAGAFSCQHWKKDEGVGDVWVNDKISPFGMVKSISSGETMVLVKVITDAKDRITGPVTTFDPGQMKRQNDGKDATTGETAVALNPLGLIGRPSSVAGRMDPISVSRFFPELFLCSNGRGSRCRDTMPLPRDKHFQARILERRDLSPDLWL